MNKCVHSPYLYALTPLYIFLIYRNAKGCFFTRDFEAEATNAKYDKNFIYPLLKHVKDRFPYKTKKDRLTAEKDINLMGSIMSTIGAIVPSTFFSYNDSELTDESIPHPFEINAYPHTSSSPTPYLPAPNWGYIFRILLQRKLVQSDDYIKYLNAIRTGSSQHLNEAIWELIQKMQEICLPQNFFAIDLKLEQTPSFKAALRTAYKILIDDEIISESEMFKSLCYNNFFMHTNFNEIAFWRITRYPPTDLNAPHDSTCMMLELAFLERMDIERKMILKYTYCSEEFPELVDKSEFQVSKKIEKMIFDNWQSIHTDKFCEHLIPELYNYFWEQGKRFIQQKKVFAKDQLLQIKLFPTDNFDSDLWMANVLAYSFNLITDFLFEVSESCDKNEFKIKEMKERIQECLKVSNADWKFHMRTILDQCFNSVVWDLRSRFWEFHYNVADRLYPLR